MVTTAAPGLARGQDPTRHCATIHLANTLDADRDKLDWQQGLRDTGLLDALAPEITAWVNIDRRAVQTGQDPFGAPTYVTRVTRSVSIRTRDGATASRTSKSKSLSRLLVDAVEELRGQTASVAIAIEPPGLGGARLTVDGPVHLQGDQQLTVGCVAAGSVVNGTASATGYEPKTFSFHAAGSPTFVVRLHPEKVSASTHESRLHPEKVATSTHESLENPSMSTVQIIGFAFGGVLLFSLLGVAVWLSMRREDPPPFPMLIFRILIALGAGGIGGIVAGWLSVQLHLGDSLAIDAVGGLALFVIVYFYNPPTKIASAGDRQRG
jgi:hypothetical protein